MGTAVSTLLDLVRATIPEANPIEWPNARLLVYLNREHREWAADLGKLPGPGWFTILATATLPANATTLDLTELLDPDDEGEFAAIKSWAYLPESGGPVPMGMAQPGFEWKYQMPVGETARGQQAPRAGWLTRPGGVPTLNFGWPSNVARNFQLQIRYKPPLLTEDGVVQTDSDHDDVLVLNTALRALLDTSETDQVIDARCRDKRQKYIDDQSNAAGEFESTGTKCVVSEEMFG